MENEIRERSVEVDGMTLTLLHKDGKWVFPLVTYYQHGLGTPLCLALLAYVEDSNEFESETIITVNLPGAERSAGCQFIDTNNNGEEVLDWLMLYGLCTPTGSRRSGKDLRGLFMLQVQSRFCLISGILLYGLLILDAFHYRI